MNVNDYISSGIVELYAMNALSPEEKKEFKRLMLLYPEIGDELRRTEQVLGDYAMAHSMNPRPQLRQQILDEITKDETGKKSKSNQSKNNISHTLTYKYLIAACLAALVISTFASWFFYSSWNEAEERYTDLLNEKNDLAQNYNTVKATLDEAVVSLVVMRDEDSKIIILNAMDSTQKYQARVYWNIKSHRTFIDVLSLPSPPEQKEYQLWAFAGGKPVDAGVFVKGEEVVQRVKDVLHADSWAVSLEPQGGSAAPTPDQMYLVSKGS